MKKLIFIIAMICLGQAVKASDQQTRIIFYRDYNYNGSAVSFRVYANDQMLIRIRNNSYYTWDCQPGLYTLTIDKGLEPFTLQVDEGQTYYVRVGLRTGLWQTNTEMLLVDPQSAVPALQYGSMRELQPGPWVRPKNRLGLSLIAGFGFNSFDMFMLENNKESSLSFGSGVGIAARYGYEFGRHFDLMAGYQYHSGGLVPAIENGTASFRRSRLSLTPSGIIPLQGGDNMRLKLGAGIDYYTGGYLKIESAGIPGGFNDTWDYKNALGFHIAMVYEMNPSENWTMDMGLRWNTVNHEINTNRFRAFDPGMMQPSGSGIDLTMSFYYNF